MKKIICVLAVLLSATARSETLQHYCQTAGVTKAEPCAQVARGCKTEKSDYAMVNMRNCMAADIVACWKSGKRGAALDACVDGKADDR